MNFSRENLFDELHQLNVSPLNPDYKTELTKLLIQKFGFLSVGDLNQEQLDEVNEFAKQFHCAIRMRWKKSSRNYERMLLSSPCFFNEIVSFKTITACQPSTSGWTFTYFSLWLTIM
jgi:hypothetical protein